MRHSISQTNHFIMRIFKLCGRQIAAPTVVLTSDIREWEQIVGVSSASPIKLSLLCCPVFGFALLCCPLFGFALLTPTILLVRYLMCWFVVVVSHCAGGRLPPLRFFDEFFSTNNNLLQGRLVSHCSGRRAASPTRFLSVIFGRKLNCRGGILPPAHYKKTFILNKSYSD